MTSKNKALFLGLIWYTCMLCLPDSARGHTSSDRYPHHDISLIAGPHNIDIEIAISLYGEKALAERYQMDTNLDGIVSPSEKSDHVNRIESAIRERLVLDVDGRQLQIVPLYTPECEIPETDSVAPIPCVLHFNFFARTPPTLHLNSRIRLDNNIQPDSAVVYSFRSHGRNGIELQPEPPAASYASQQGADQRVFVLQCTAVPFPALTTTNLSFGNGLQYAFIGSALLVLTVIIVIRKRFHFSFHT
ncbi:MAG: hypothetical protein ABIH23_29085 [bacterium]